MQAKSIFWPSFLAFLAALITWDVIKYLLLTYAFAGTSIATHFDAASDNTGSNEIKMMMAEYRKKKQQEENANKPLELNGPLVATEKNESMACINNTVVYRVGRGWRQNAEEFCNARSR